VPPRSLARTFPWRTYTRAITFAFASHYRYLPTSEAERSVRLFFLFRCACSGAPSMECAKRKTTASPPGMFIDDLGSPRKVYTRSTSLEFHFNRRLSRNARSTRRSRDKASPPRKTATCRLTAHKDPVTGNPAL